MDEALRLLRMSKSSLFEDGGAERAADPISQIFARIRQHAERTKRGAYSWGDLLEFLGTAFRVSGCACAGVGVHVCVGERGWVGGWVRARASARPRPFPPALLTPPPARLQPEQIRQCLLDYASINVFQLTNPDSPTPGILLAAA